MYYTGESSVLQKLYERNKMQRIQTQKLLAAQESLRDQSMSTKTGAENRTYRDMFQQPAYSDLRYFAK